MLGEAQGAARHQELLKAAGDFLAEMLSPYEMAHRGVQDAIAALRHLNETLEEEIKRIAYAVHDEAGQLLVAVRSEEHTSELQSQSNLVCRLLLEKKKKTITQDN